MNIAEIEMELADLVEEPFDRSEFVFKFMSIFNPPKATLTRLENAASEKLDPGADLLWSRKMHFQVAEAGQTANVIDALKELKVAKNKAPRFLISTDGVEFSALDTKIDETLHCDFDKLNDEFDFFLPLAGIDKYEAIEETQADIKAAGRLSKLYDEIVRVNPDWHTPEKRHALNQFMTRILFCLFAEDTGSFQKDHFVKVITEIGGEDGEHIQVLLKQIFDAMNIPEKERSGLPMLVNRFPYVNGGLFADDTEVPAFSKRAKQLLIEAANLDWRDINPDIFGSMIQAVVDPEMRGDLGMHYTSVPNIMKVLQPLFLMSLEEDFDKAVGHREERSMLRKLLNRIHKIRVFDPACGSGNFLIIAYRELRKLEMRIYERLDKISDGTTTWREGSGVRLSNFYGIELADFAAETAKLSLWIAEYQMNQRFKETFGNAPKPFPLQEGGHIFHDNALRRNWLEICPTPIKTVQKEKVLDLATIAPVQATEEVIDEEVETYICGNPPYLGSVNQTASQKCDMSLVFSNFVRSFKKLDYVSAWYFKGAQYCSTQNAMCAFVATNSICQGEQVGLLWPNILDMNISILFAHRSFSWKNLAANNAAVTCVIVGLGCDPKREKVIFEEDRSLAVKQIGPYLIDTHVLYVEKVTQSISGLPEVVRGNMPYDGGNLILSPQEKKVLVNEYPEIEPMIRRLYGSQEHVRGIERWCIWIRDSDLELALSTPPILKRIEDVKAMRLASSDQGANKMAAFPHRFREVNEPVEHAIIIPRLTTDNRPYIQAGIIGKSDIATDLVYLMCDAPLYVFSLISSKLHIEWIRTVCGRFKTDYRYSNTLGYNTFPVPPLTDEHKQTLDTHAWDIIAAREAHPGKTIAWLYDPKTMPDNLLTAHKALDDTLEKIYIGRPFKNDTERLEHLFKMYAEMTAKKEA